MLSPYTRRGAVRSHLVGSMKLRSVFRWGEAPGMDGVWGVLLLSPLLRPSITITNVMKGDHALEQGPERRLNLDLASLTVRTCC
jgi:hypothetical protein